MILTNNILLAVLFYFIPLSIKSFFLFLYLHTWYSMLKCCIKFVHSPLLLLMLLTLYIVHIFDNNNCCCCYYSMLLNAYTKLLCCNVFADLYHNSQRAKVPRDCFVFWENLFGENL